MENNINKFIDNFSILNLKLSVQYYFYTTKDIALNIVTISNTNIYNNFTYVNILRYYGVSFFIGYLILFVPIVFKITGSISVFTLVLKSTFVIAVLSIFYAIPIYFIKKIFLLKKIFLTLILAFSFSFPVISLLSIPMFLDMNTVSSDFFIGGGSAPTPKTTTNNEYVQLYIIISNILSNVIGTIILPVLWLTKILEISWWKLLLIFLIIPIFVAKFILFINPIIYNFTMGIDKLVNLFL